MSMTMKQMCRYAEMGALNYIETLEKLLEMCIEVGDEDAADEYRNKIEVVRFDAYSLMKVNNMFRGIEV